MQTIQSWWVKLGMLVVRSDLNTFRFYSLQIWIPSDLNPINFESLQIWVCLLLPPISDLNPFISIFEFFLIRFRLWSSNVCESVFCFHPFLIWIPSDLNPIIYSIPSHLNPYRFEFLQIHFRRFRLWSSKVNESAFYFHPFQIWIPSDLNPFRIESIQNFYIWILSNTFSFVRSSKSVNLCFTSTHFDLEFIAN